MGSVFEIEEAAKAEAEEAAGTASKKGAMPKGF